MSVNPIYHRNAIGQIGNRWNPLRVLLSVSRPEGP